MWIGPRPRAFVAAAIILLGGACPRGALALDPEPAQGISRPARPDPGADDPPDARPEGRRDAGAGHAPRAGHARRRARRETEPDASRAEARLAERLNAHTVSIVTGTPGGTYFRLGADLAFVLDREDGLRVLPILGKGAGENAYDIRFLKGVDLGFVRTDTLDQLRQDTRLRDVDRHIQYVAKLFNDELHVVARKEVADIRQLAGKRVTFDVRGSGTDYSGRAMFKGLGVPVEGINVDQGTALDMLVKGEVDAVVSVAAKPVSVLAGFDAGDRFHLVPSPFPDTMGEAYVPATLTAADYPRLLKAGESVDTIAVGTVLGVFAHPKGSERYNRIARFVDAFFGGYDKFLDPRRHPKWREVNLAASVAGWTRFRPAQEWLDNHKGEGEGEAQAVASQSELDGFLADRSATLPADREKVYQAYLRWRRERGSQAGIARR